VGSSGPSGEAPSASSVPSAAASAPALDPRLNRSPHHGGFVGLLLRTARDSSVTTEQKVAVSGIQQTLHDEEPPFLPLKEYQDHLAAAIRAGQVSVAAFHDDYAAVDKVEIEREQKQADALNALHKTLEPDARHALVASVRTRLGPMFRKRPELSLDAGTDVANLPWVKHRVARLSGEVGLDDAQREKVVPIVARATFSPQVTDAHKEEIHKHADALLDAFDKDDFDASKVDLSATGTHAPAHESLEHEAMIVAKILPLLTPAQREKLAAAKLRRVGRWLEDSEPWSPFEDFELTGRVLH
jgi:Spy/CpxP family protein refolding chaperone